MTPDRVPSRPAEPPPLEAQAPDARTVEIAGWLGQFSRTLKTCRLYDSRNPTSIKFREDLAAHFVALLESGGPISLEFTASEVRHDGHPVMTARSREDNFAMPFYRDGLRALTFQPGADAAQLNTLIDLVLRVTSRSASEREDLVALLWDADLPNFDMSYVSSETDADLGDESSAPASAANAPTGEPIPWPGRGGGAGGGIGAAGGEGAAGSSPGLGVVQGGAAAAEANDTEALRSEDWLAGEPAHELEQCYLQIDATRAAEVERFAREVREEHEAGLFDQTLDMVRDALSADLHEEDRADLSELLTRVLNDAISGARWADARATTTCLADVTGGAWDATPLVESLSHPESIVTASVVRHLDESPVAELGEFAAFARTLGEPAAEWLMGIVARAEHQRTRRTLVRALGEMCGDNPERLAPWLADEHWFVVRNAVIVVSSGVGGAPVGMLTALVHHPEPRVRHEVVSALANSPADAARPLLLQFIHDPEPAIAGAALHQLGGRRNPEAAGAILALVLDPEFRKRSIEEVRSVTSALGGCGGDEALPHLEEQLHASRWFDAGAANYYQAIARCIGKIGTPAAIALLERGAASKVGATRDACRLVLKGMGRG